jgi:hypothetical protein
MSERGAALSRANWKLWPLYAGCPNINAALLMVLSALTGCANSDPVHFANGNPGYRIRCDLGMYGLGLCYQKAGELCGPNGYRLYAWNGQLLPVKATEGFATDEDTDAVDVEGFQPKQILIACGHG